MVAVRTRVEPEVRFAVEPLRTISAAGPTTTVKVRVLLVSEAPVAWVEMLPMSAPVTVTEATPAVAVSPPSPVTVPVPAVLLKVTVVPLSPVSTFPAAS